MINAPFLDWKAAPSLKGPIAQIVANLNADPALRVNLRGGYQEHEISAAVVCVDNISNAVNITVTINGVNIVVSSNTRLNIPLPQSSTTLDLAGASGTPTLIFYANAEDAPSESLNYSAIIAATVNATVPTGSLIMWVTAIAPTGWLLCDGSAVSRATFATLFALIGISFGAGDGVTTFNLPDLRDSVPIGVSPGGLSSGRTTARVLAARGGEETHTPISAEGFAHNHAGRQVGDSVRGDISAGGFVVTPTGNFAIQTDGGGAAFNVMQPFQVVNFIIKT